MTSDNLLNLVNQIFFMQIRKLLLNEKNLFVIFLFISLATNAQITPKIYMQVSDLPGISKRSLVVALLEEDPKEIEKLDKKSKKNPELLANYKEEIKSYNDYIKSGIQQIWKLNNKVEFKSFSEVMELMKNEKENKSHNYMVLVLGYLEGSRVLSRSNVSVKALIYSRAETDLIKPDYKIYIPNSDMRVKRSGFEISFSGSTVDYSPFAVYDLHLALIAMQNNIQYMQGKKAVIPFEKYLSSMVQKNCGQQTGRTVLIDSVILYSKGFSDSQEMIAELKDINYKITSTEEVNKAFVEGKENTYFVISLPYGIIPGGNYEKRAAGKIIVDCKTKEFISETEWLKPNLFGKSNEVLIRDNDLKNLAKCKK